MLRFGLGVAAGAAALDRFSKWLIPDLWDLPPDSSIEVTSFFNLVMVHNTGVSFGLLQSDSPAMPWILSTVSGAIVVVLVLWLRRVRGRLLAAGMGLVIGGAASNVFDRLSVGAVADFFDLHLASYHWPAFNLADSAIVIGVAILLLDALSGGEESHKKGT